MASSTEQSIRPSAFGSPISQKISLPSGASVARPDFDVWAAAVREQMLAVLQKKSAQ
ncbi:MAG TPA: hypothetical protein V6D06_10085 [Trichocoleus sp.]